MKCTKCFADNPEKTKYCGECGTNLTSAEDLDTAHTRTIDTTSDSLLRGTLFTKRYEIIECLGRGGMGTVYKAYDWQLKDDVALKFLKSEIASDRKTLDRFSNELKIARKIVHKNVGRMYELMEDDGDIFITMEYVPGQDLRGLLKQSHQLTPPTTISIAKQICEGLIEAHRLGVVHRDLKPSNIMIDKHGDARIMDFGVARSMGASDAVKDKRVSGTPAYMSPEQASGEKVDQRSDIYSLGIILFEMLTGVRPFSAENPDDYAEMHVNKNPPRPTEIRPQIPPFLENIVLKCLKKDRNKRYQHVKDVLDDLDAHEEATRTYLPYKKNKSVWRFLYLVPVVLLVLIGLYLAVGPKTPTVTFAPEGGKIPLFVMLFNNNSGDESFENWERALSDGIIQSLLASQNIRVRTGDTRFSILSSLDLLEAKEYSTQDFMEVANQGETDHILFGNYTKAEDTFIIQAILKNVASGENIASDPVQGTGETTFLAAIDQLSRWAMSELDAGSDAAAADSVLNIEATLTSSPEALKLYTLGKQYYREGKLEESNEILLEAVEIDPEFALAHKRISENYHYLSDFDQAKSHAQTALNLIDEKSIQAQYLVKGWAYTILEESYEKAIAVYQKLLEALPDDEEGNIYLGAIYRNMEEWDLAFERFSHILEIGPSIYTEKNSISVENLVQCYQAKGMYGEAVDFIREHKQSFANESLYHFNLGFSFFCQRKFSLALVEFNEALVIDPEDSASIEMLGHVYHAQDDFSTAESYYRQLVDSAYQSAQLWGRHWLVNLCLTQGQFNKCSEFILKGLGESEKHDMDLYRLDYLQQQSYLSLQRGDFENGLQSTLNGDDIASEIVLKRANITAAHLRGLLLLKLNRVAEAKETAKNLTLQIEESKVKSLRRYYHHLSGAIAESEGLTEQAIENYELALSYLSSPYETIDKHALFIYPLALANYQNGQIDKAQELLSKLIDLTAGRLVCGDLYAKSYYWLGKVYQEKGQMQEALLHYRTFLKIWENADSDIAELEDARGQQALLKRELQD